MSLNPNSSSRTYGPLTPLHIKVLTQTLDKAKAVYCVYTDDDLINQAQVREKNSPEASPFFHNTPGISMKEYLFIDIELKDLMLVRADLIRLGFENSQNMNSDESLQAEEFICPKCNFVQTSKGLCHVHHVPLVPYYEKALGSQKNKALVIRFVFAIFLAIVIGFIVQSAMK